jgi:hypothetical protein
LTFNSWLILVFYFISGTILSLAFTSHHPVHVYLFASVNAVGWIVTVVFWSLLAPGLFANAQESVGEKFYQTFSHSLNLLFPLIDLWLSKTRMRWRHLCGPILVVTLYMCVVLIARYQFNVLWPYSFMNSLFGLTGFNTGGALAFIAGIYLSLTLFFWVTMKITDLRDRNKPKEVFTMSPIPKDTSSSIP